MSLDSIVKVTISKQTKTPSRAGFGEGAFVSEGAVFAELIKPYADIDEINDDVAAGLLDSEVQTAAQRYFGQDNAPPKLWVIKKGADRAHVQRITFAGDFVTGNTVNIDVDAATINEPFDTDSDTTLTNLAASIQAEAGVTTAVADTASRSILVTGAAVNTEVLLENLSVTGGASQTTGSIALVTQYDEVKTYTESIQRAQDVDDSWYGLTIESKANADQEAVADYTEPLTKFFAYSTSDANAKDAASSADIHSELKAKTYDRSLGLYSADAANHPELGWIGGQLPKDPGSITWANKSISGAIVDTLSTGEKNAVHGKNGNTYTTIAGLNVTEEGKVASGEFMDIVRGIDFLVARMQENVFALIANSDKVPYDDDGIAAVENEMNGVLELGVANTIISSDYTITVPAAADVPAADKAARILRNMRFSAKLVGAIHKAEIDGTLTF